MTANILLLQGLLNYAQEIQGRQPFPPLQRKNGSWERLSSLLLMINPVRQLRLLNTMSNQVEMKISPLQSKWLGLFI